MGFPNAAIRTTRNGGTPVVGFRQDALVGETILASVDNAIGALNFHWRLIGRPEGSTAGGAGPEPIDLGTSPTCSFVIDTDSGYRKDGTYDLECVLNEGGTNETKLLVGIARLTGLALPDGRVLRKMGGFEDATVDTADALVRQGWAKMDNRWLEALRALIAGSSSVAGASPGLSYMHFGTGAAYAPVRWKIGGSFPSHLGVNTIARGGLPPAANMLFAWPELIASDAQITKLATAVINAPSGLNAHLDVGLYRNYGPHILYPKDRLARVSFVTLPSINRWRVSSITPVTVAPGDLVWIVINTSDINFQLYYCLDVGALPPILGIPPAVDDDVPDSADNVNGSRGVGWQHAATFADGLPATFPTSAPVVMKTGDASFLPAIFLQYEAP